MKEINLSIKVQIVETFEDNPDTIARIHYPDEGNTISIIKGLNRVDLDGAIYHEVGHLIDWYLSENNQKIPVEIREKNADIIGVLLQLELEIRKEINNILNDYHEDNAKEIL